MQGVPLMLFISSPRPERRLLQPLHNTAGQRISLYVDDGALFIRPTEVF
jgi:hypothetical protein